MEMRKRRTSKEANLLNWSIFTAPMDTKIPVPIKTKLNQKSQKNRVPVIDIEKIEIMIDYFAESPKKLPKKPKTQKIMTNKRSFFLCIYLRI